MAAQRYLNICQGHDALAQGFRNVGNGGATLGCATWCFQELWDHLRLMMVDNGEWLRVALNGWFMRFDKV